MHTRIVYLVQLTTDSYVEMSPRDIVALKDAGYELNIRIIEA